MLARVGTTAASGSRAKRPARKKDDLNDEIPYFYREASTERL